MMTTEPAFEIEIGLAGDAPTEVMGRVIGVVLDCDAYDDAHLVVEQWDPPAVRKSFANTLFASVGVLTLTKSSIASMRGVLNEMTAALDGTADADRIIINVGKEEFALCDITPEMIEQWLPAAS